MTFYYSFADASAPSFGALAGQQQQSPTFGGASQAASPGFGNQQQTGGFGGLAASNNTASPFGGGECVTHPQIFSGS